PINQFLGHIGLNQPLWFFDPTWAKPALLILGLWGIGDAIVLYLAGLLNVPRDLYEAIAIEGANAWQRFRYVTLPMPTSAPPPRVEALAHPTTRCCSTRSGSTSRPSATSTWATPRPWRG